MAVEEGIARAIGNLLGHVRVVTMAAIALATGERLVRKDCIIVAPLTTANATVIQAVFITPFHVRAIGFIAATVDVIQVDGDEEATHLIRPYWMFAFVQLLEAGSTV